METITISMDAYLDCLQHRFDTCNPDWKREESIALFPALLDLIRDCGVDPEKSAPDYIVDNFLINGDFVAKSEWKEDRPHSYEEYDGDWEKFCDDCCLIYNENYACVQF